MHHQVARGPPLVTGTANGLHGTFVPISRLGQLGLGESVPVESRNAATELVHLPQASPPPFITR